MAISRMIDRVGQVLGGRYRLVAPIGTGASASVYLADDVTLRRRVAVKILHDALADDPAFLERFRSEARAAAALNHPHIMAVYDWGHGDVPYLVTEYLGGGSLRSMLDLGRKLTPSQGLLVGLESTRGLAHAHRQGFVHRDIKPANLLFDEDGRLRIADFGLARALAEAAWTEPMGAVLGTARYASPEQARGEHLDGRSDVYSLAVVLVEAVSGRAPFTSDTALGLLMARIDKPLPVPDELGPLAPAVRLAGVPDPGERPDAAAFEALLMEAAHRLERPTPLPLAGTMRHEDAVALDERDPTTQYLSERKALAALEPEIMSAPPGTTTDGIAILHEGEGQPETRRLERTGAEAAPGAASASGAGGDVLAGGAEGLGRKERRAERKRAKAERKRAKVEARGGRRRRRWPWVVLAVVVLAGAGAGGWAYWYNEVREVTHPVPELVSTNVADLGPALAAGEWIAQQVDREEAGTVRGQILAQLPAPGTALKEGATIELVVSLGPPPVPVPTALGGLPRADAEAQLVAAQLAVGEVATAHSEDVPAGHVIALAEGTGEVAYPGTPIGLVVSDGPVPRTVPANLEGDPQAEVVAALEDLRLGVEVRTEPSETVTQGLVLSVPQAGQQVARDSTVVIVVSSGPPLIAVPDVASLSTADAATRLGGAGLVVKGVQGNPVNPVQRTTPAAGEMVRRGTEVTIITG